MKRLTLLTAAVVAAASTAVALADREDADDRDDHDHHAGCHAVHAVIIDAPSTENCMSPFGFCAAGEARGNQGLNGSTLFTLDGFSSAPATAPGFGETSGVLVYTTRHGTLTVRETGVGNMGSKALGGVGASLEQVLEGTGRFSGATGTLYLASSAAEGQYTAIVTGARRSR